MNQHSIDSLIEMSGIQPGDSVWMDKKQLGLLDQYVIYLGKDQSQIQWVVGRFENGVRVLTEEQIRFLIKSSKKIRINPFTGNTALRQKAVDRMMEKLDSPTFLLILRHSQNHKQEVQKANSSFKWRRIAVGTGLGLGLAGAVVLGIKAWQKWSEDKNK